MVPYLSWLERAVSNRICRRFESYRNHQGKGGIFSLVILIPPIYDHCQVRVTHDLIYHVLQCNSVEPGAKTSIPARLAFKPSLFL